jgi:hypothetical protein
MSLDGSEETGPGGGDPLAGEAGVLGHSLHDAADLLLDLRQPAAAAPTEAQVFADSLLLRRRQLAVGVSQELLVTAAV